MYTGLELYKMFKNGSEEAFEAIFKQYYTGLCLYASSVVKSDFVAEEIVEDLFLKIWQDYISIEITTSLRAYLYKSVHNRCIKYLRHQKVEQKYNIYYLESVNNNALDFSVSSDYPIANLISQELEKEIEEAVNNLPDQCRECFCLHRYDELTYPEIAEKLNISVNTVKTQMCRALQKLREALKDFLPLFLL
jgi:RNA polymerase sigma-70 factor (ECF subfamily)